MENNNTMMIVFIAGIILIAVILVLNSGNVKVITGSEQKNSISVSGNAKLEVDPDQAEVFLRIETFNEKADNAKNENAKISDTVVKALKKEGIKDNEIETASFYLSPRYRWDQNSNKNILEGYTATKILKVTTTEIEKAGKIIDTAVDSGANGVDSVRFGLTKEKQKEVSGEALIRASQVAKEKAESLANSVGVNLGKVISIQESNFNYVTYDYAPRMDMMEAAKSAPTQIEPGKVEVDAFVSIAYEIK